MKRNAVAAMFKACLPELGELSIVASRVYTLLGGDQADLEEAMGLMKPKLDEASRARMKADGFGDNPKLLEGIGGIFEHAFQPAMALLTGKIMTAREVAALANAMQEARERGT